MGPGDQKQARFLSDSPAVCRPSSLGMCGVTFSDFLISGDLTVLTPEQEFGYSTYTRPHARKAAEVCSKKFELSCLTLQQKKGHSFAKNSSRDCIVVNAFSCLAETSDLVCVKYRYRAAKQ